MSWVVLSSSFALWVVLTVMVYAILILRALGADRLRELWAEWSWVFTSWS